MNSGRHLKGKVPLSFMFRPEFMWVPIRCVAGRPAKFSPGLNRISRFRG